ncbi:MAG: MBL fold metallo-hydrolase [Sphaerochaeta associata]|uniref:MBL fold metallo-hydrolase n=1 Tax=Sphaerochaeta associata TaxID=1129264 RepID=UPI002B1EB205|nr:MBL fold metallo-hydrolase [Sphaerochaeta associata]MEA5106900.1 MBL fold metallo-hydrolase [Sphaerochaeta associata]
MQHIIELTLQMPDGRKEVPIHPIVLQDDEYLTLVDCGFIGSLRLLEIELGKHGISIEQLTALVLTHHDHDHMGAAAALKRANPRIQIYSSLEESVYISAREKPLRLVQAEELQAQLPPQQQAFGRMFCDMLRRVEPVTVDAHLTDSQETGWCGGCQVLFSAGHTPGHLSLYCKELDAVIVGDAFALEQNTPVLANPQFTLDVEMAKRSMEKLLSLKARTYYCYHGGIYRP